jgi:hypothetical protein
VTRSFLRYFAPALLFLFLTALTQVGGLAHLIGTAIASAIPPLRGGSLLRRMSAVVIALTAYGGMTAFVVPPLAASMGRVPLPCSSAGTGAIVAATWLTCALNRGYVRPEIRDLVTDLASATAQHFPGSKITTLEGNLPFIDGFPLLPHLSHRDGKKVDIAFFYRSVADDAAVAQRITILAGVFRLPTTEAGRCNTL